MFHFTKIISALKFLFLLYLSQCLVACGDSSKGDSSEGDNSAQIPEDIINVQIPEETIDPIEQMNTLVASADFNFTSKSNVSVKIELVEYQQERTFVSLYSDYQRLESGLYYPRSESRLLAGQLENGSFEQDFIKLTQQQSYLVEVWFYDHRPPLQKEIMIIDNTLTW